MSLSQNAEEQVITGYNIPGGIVPDRNFTIYHVVGAIVARWGLEDLREVLKESGDLLKKLEEEEN